MSGKRLIKRPDKYLDTEELEIVNRKAPYVRVRYEDNEERTFDSNLTDEILNSDSDEPLKFKDLSVGLEVVAKWGQSHYRAEIIELFNGTTEVNEQDKSKSKSPKTTKNQQKKKGTTVGTEQDKPDSPKTTKNQQKKKAKQGKAATTEEDDNDSLIKAKKKEIAMEKKRSRDAKMAAAQTLANLLYANPACDKQLFNSDHTDQNQASKEVPSKSNTEEKTSTAETEDHLSRVSIENTEKSQSEPSSKGTSVLKEISDKNLANSGSVFQNTTQADPTNREDPPPVCQSTSWQVPPPAPLNGVQPHSLENLQHPNSYQTESPQPFSYQMLLHEDREEEFDNIPVLTPLIPMNEIHDENPALKSISDRYMIDNNFDRVDSVYTCSSSQSKDIMHEPESETTTTTLSRSLSVLNSGCDLCMRKDITINDLQHEVRHLRTQVDYLQQKAMEGGNVNQESTSEVQNCSGEPAEQRKYRPKTRPTVEMSDYYEIGCDDQVKLRDGYQLLAPGSSIAVKSLWLHSILATITRDKDKKGRKRKNSQKREKPGFDVVKRLMDGFYEPWELSCKGGTAAFHNSPIYKSLRLYAEHHLNMETPQFNRAWLEKMVAARVTVKRLKLKAELLD